MEHHPIVELHRVSHLQHPHKVAHPLLNTLNENKIWWVGWALNNSVCKKKKKKILNYRFHHNKSKCPWQNPSCSHFSSQLYLSEITFILFIVWYLKECVLIFLNPLFSLMKGVTVHVQQSSTSPIEAFQQLKAQHRLHLSWSKRHEWGCQNNDIEVNGFVYIHLYLFYIITHLFTLRYWAINCTKLSDVLPHLHSCQAHMESHDVKWDFKNSLVIHINTLLVLVLASPPKLLAQSGLAAAAGF